MTEVTIAIVGAGFSGLGAAIKLQQHGFDDFVIFDRGSDFGGTWRDNTYPGAACDVPSHLYSYSFALNPSWSRSFSEQPEIHRYINNVADRHDIHSRTKFNVEVRDCRWNTGTKRWDIDTDTGAYSARYLVAAMGPLCEPNLPDIKGINDFGGTIFHSARWDHSAELSGKRVAVIGTGASSIQIAPAIAGTVGHLDVYQRTAPWVLPRRDRPYTNIERWAFTNVPGFQRLSRMGIYASHELVSFALTHAPSMLKPAERIGKANIARGIADPALRAKVTPKFTPGCKRILLSNNYYPALGRENVDVVTDAISHITESCIVTVDGTEREVDAIVVATGFHVTDSPAFQHIFGTDGRSLAETWESEGGVSAYKGSTVAGFPNLFVMVGPGTGLGHTSMVYMIESQLNYLIDEMKTARAQSLSTIDLKKSAQTAYNRKIQKNLRNSVWVNGGCASWYQDTSGNITALWPGFTFNFRRATKHFDADSYNLTTDHELTGTPA